MSHQEHTLLSWRLIECKVAYYAPEYVHSSRYKDVTIPDEEYDALEQRYLTLCRELGRLNTIVHKVYPGFEDLVGPHSMMELDRTRPSVQLVMRKLASPKKRRRRTPRG